MTLSPLIRFGTSTWAYEGWHGQVYKKQYAKSTFARECLGEQSQYQYQGEPLFRTVSNTGPRVLSKTIHGGRRFG